MRAAAYVRMSTKGHQDDSPEVQLASIRAFVASKGWELVADCVYRDDAKSRAEFKRRPALADMLRDAERKRFDVLVMRDDDRLGGDLYRTGMVLTTLVDDCRVQVWFYHTGQQVRLDDPTCKIIQAVKGYASELERLKTSERTRENHEHKARSGHVPGGACYGYRNVEIKKADGSRDHVVHEIEPEQAKVVVDIFQRYASGEGVRTIAHALNDAGVPSPRVGDVGSGSWSPSCIHAILHRDRYRGQIVWGKTHKTYQGGTKVRVPSQDVITTQAENLRIVPDDLWDRVQAKARKSAQGNPLQPQRRGPQGRKPKHLLTGIARCACCGGPIQGANGKTSHRVTLQYSCGWHRDRGEAVCASSLHRPKDGIDAVVMDWLRDHVLTETVITDALKEVRGRLAQRGKQADARIPALEQQIGKLDAELRSLGASLLGSKMVPQTVIDMMNDREQVRDRLRAELAALKVAPATLDLEVRRMEVEARKRLKDLQRMLTRSPEGARAVLEAVLTGPLKFEPIETQNGPRFRITGAARAAGVVEPGIGSFVCVPNEI